jgi:alpha-ketoglutarate-dependent taurine dioxygenase
MRQVYEGVQTRFLTDQERLISSKEQEMPWVIEPQDDPSLSFLKQFLHEHSESIRAEMARYGAILLRGFQVQSEQDFEDAVLSIQGLRGISEAFMSEEGRVQVGSQKFVLHTNAVYKTGGTLYLGGFHSENYYSADVPRYICFYCKQPSAKGGETGLIQMEKVTQALNADLLQRLKKQSFFVTKWRVAEILERYPLSEQALEAICLQHHLPIIGEGVTRSVLLYKPSVFKHPDTQKSALQINYFEVHGLNEALRKCFMNDYAGDSWFWHRFVWRLPTWVLKVIERIYIMVASMVYSPKQALTILKNKILSTWADYRLKGLYDPTKVGSQFTSQDVDELAQLMRQYYVSCLWQPGDILLVDNRLVVHAGMPGEGPRTIRAMICDPLAMSYASVPQGCIEAQIRPGSSIGAEASQRNNLI